MLTQRVLVALRGPTGAAGDVSSETDLARSMSSSCGLIHQKPAQYSHDVRLFGRQSTPEALTTKKVQSRSRGNLIIVAAFATMLGVICLQGTSQGNCQSAHNTDKAQLLAAQAGVAVSSARPALIWHAKLLCWLCTCCWLSLRSRSGTCRARDLRPAASTPRVCS